MVVSPIEMSTHQFIKADLPDNPVWVMNRLFVRIFSKYVMQVNGIRNLKFLLPKIGTKSSSLLFSEAARYGSYSFCHLGDVSCGEF
jgi:hypothetical protein